MAASSTAAFPTLSPTASTNRKTFFDSAATGSIAGHALVAVYPLTDRKGRAKHCYVTVHSTLFEVHKSQKDARNKKAAKHLVDFGDVFNVSIHSEPVQIKNDCVCVMDPSTSFFVRPTDSDYDLQAWFDWILERSRECRSTKLLRPVFREEFFEASWDVQIVRRPKLRRDYVKQAANSLDPQSDDLAEKRPNLLGHRRLCICPTSFLLFTIGCRPTSNVDAPFERHTFVELPLNVISNYGTQERFFFIRIGRCSEIGSGELWMATEHGASARAMHERISEINLRESERRRAQGIKINLPTISSSVLKSRAHRERSQTQNQLQKQDSQLRLRGVSETSKLSSDQVSSESPHKAMGQSSRAASGGTASPCVGAVMAIKQQHHASNSSLSSNSHQLGPYPLPCSSRADSVSCLQSIPERSQLQNEHNPDISADNSAPVKKSSIAGMLAFRFGSKISAGSYGNPATKCSAGGRMDQLTAPSSPAPDSGAASFEQDAKGSDIVCNTSLVNISNQSARNSLVGSVLGLRLNRRNSQRSNHNAGAENTAATSNGKPQKCQTTLKQQQQQQRSVCGGGAANCSSFSAQPSYDCAEDYMTYDADDRSTGGSGGTGNQQYGYTLNAPSGSLGSRMSATASTGLRGSESRKSSCSVYSGGPVRQFSTSSVGAASGPSPDQHQSTKAVAMSSDYMEMDQSGGMTTEPVFALTEVEAYISNSSDSCWTPGSNTTKSGDLGNAGNAPRAYSLGSKPIRNNIVGGSDSPTQARHEISQQQFLLHPSCSSTGSPPKNYLKKSGQAAARSLHKEALEASLMANDRKEQRPREGERKEELRVERGQHTPTAGDTASEMRKRAHSVGSKTWVNPSLRKFTTTSHKNKALGQSNDDKMMLADGSSSRRNTCEANKSMGSGSSCYPYSEDHVEIDFDRDESPSMDSIPSLHSRNSSVGVQMSSDIRSALDSLAHMRGSYLPGRPSPRQKGIGMEIERKRSVPEMLHQTQSPLAEKLSAEIESPSPSSSGFGTNDQNRLHPHRRSTYDGPAVRMRNDKRHKGRSPPRGAAAIGSGSQISASQSNSSGISTSRSSESGGHHPIGGGVEPIVERKESDEYVLLSTPTTNGGGSNRELVKDGRHQQQQQLSVRTIGTIMESSTSSFSPSPSVSSGGSMNAERQQPGEQSNNNSRKARSNNRRLEKVGTVYGATPSTHEDFPDEYALFSSPPSLTDVQDGGVESSSTSNNALVDPGRKNRQGNSHSPNRSPHMSRRQHSHHVAPTPVRSYFPVGGVSPSPTRRKTSAANYPRSTEPAAMKDVVHGSPRKHTCPSNLSQQRTMVMKRTTPKGERRAQHQQHCDYAVILPQQQQNAKE